MEQPSPPLDLGSSRAMPFIFATYITGLLIANAMGAKVVQFGPLVLSVGALAYPLTFVLQDVVNELYGKKVASTFVSATALSLGILAVFANASAQLNDANDPTMTDAYNRLFGHTLRIVIASMVAFYVGGLVDVWVFFWARRKWPGSLLARKVTSTLVSQFVDSALFVAIGFAGIMNPMSLVIMWLSQYALKQVIAIGGLPITFVLIHRIRT